MSLKGDGLATRASSGHPGLKVCGRARGKAYYMVGLRGDTGT